MRPNLTSRPLEEVTKEVRGLVENGFREVVLTGIHLGHYGVDWNRERPRDKDSWVRLSHLLRQLADLPGDFRVRLSSIEATEVTRELIDVMAENFDRIAPHLHISMQSGSDSVLRRMRRRWGSRRFVDRCNLLRERLDQPAITTDVIVGFPGETEAEFEQTLQTCRDAGFSKIHGFPFSARRGTPAWDMPEQLPKKRKTERIHRLAEVEAELRDQYFASLCGKKLRVLVETPLEEGRYVGTSCRYAPVELSADSEDVGRFVDVEAGEVRGGRIIASSQRAVGETPRLSGNKNSGQLSAQKS